MSYISNSNNLRSKLFKPNSIPIFASIAIHAFVLGIALPSTAIFSKKETPTKPQEVQLIELTPAEQARLPQTFQPQTKKNSFRQPLRQRPVRDISPLRRRFYESISPLPLHQYSPISPKRKQVTSFYPNLSEFPSTIPKTNIPHFKPRAIPAPPPPNINYPIQALNNNNLPVESEDSSPFRSDIKPLAPRESYFFQQPQQQQNFSQRQQEIAANSPNETPNTQLMNLRQQNLLAQVRKRAEDLRYNPKNTTNEEATKNDVNWLAKVEESQPKKLEITGTYPKDACVRNLKGTVVYGVLLNDRGEATDLDIIKSSGYPIFDRQAQQDIKSQNVANETEEIKAYRVYVNFESDDRVCPSLGVTKQKSNPVPKDVSE